MKFLLLLVLLHVVFSVPPFHGTKIGEKTIIQIAEEKVKAFTRTKGFGSLQTYNIEGPNKNKWIDEKGKTVGDPKNYEFKAPGSLLIKKVSALDEAHYDYIPLVPPKPVVLPPGLHIDPGVTGVTLNFFPTSK
ncbi:unnamed protein product [Caenorhabditis angaria]|uniref:Uncharacterized protein n=1 Tax=Caenorhabditis angaria TaxID=860376 RepID=A0A9P1IUV6_9PELO|nr:unnamed protein product [Caenorhabditis angaria]